MSLLVVLLPELRRCYLGLKVFLLHFWQYKYKETYHNISLELSNFIESGADILLFVIKKE